MLNQDKNKALFYVDESGGVGEVFCVKRVALLPGKAEVALESYKMREEGRNCRRRVEGRGED